MRRYAVRLRAVLLFELTSGVLVADADRPDDGGEPLPAQVLGDQERVRHSLVIDHRLGECSSERRAVVQRTEVAGDSTSRLEDPGGCGCREVTKSVLGKREPTVALGSRTGLVAGSSPSKPEAEERSRERERHARR